MKSSIPNIDAFKKRVNKLMLSKSISLVKIHEIWDKKTIIYLVMEYCQGGKLNDYIIQKDIISEDDAGLIMYQIFNLLA